MGWGIPDKQIIDSRTTFLPWKVLRTINISSFTNFFLEFLLRPQIFHVPAFRKLGLEPEINVIDMDETSENIEAVKAALT